MQHICRRKPIPECDFNKVALQIYWETRMLKRGFSKVVFYFSFYKRNMRKAIRLIWINLFCISFSTAKFTQAYLRKRISAKFRQVLDLQKRIPKEYLIGEKFRQGKISLGKNLVTSEKLDTFPWLIFQIFHFSPTSFTFNFNFTFTRISKFLLKPKRF